MEIDLLIKLFLEQYNVGITNLHRSYFKNSNKLSLQALIAELTEELKSGCITFLNKENPIEELNQYLFYIANVFLKKKSKNFVKQATDHVCPGCLYLGKTNVITYFNYVFKCDNCSHELKNGEDPKLILFYRTFSRHNKAGYKCNDCGRFIPNPLENTSIITCPYFDCCFVGNLNDLDKMRHPTIKNNRESLTLDAVKEHGGTMHDTVADIRAGVHACMEIAETLENKVSFLKDIIDYQRNSVPYNSSEFTVKHKELIYISFDNLLQKFPTEMVDYLLNGSSCGYSGFQCKVFQEYIRLLEGALPISFKKNKKVYRVDSLLDENISLFDGISDFEGIVSANGVIKNGTKEFYIGGRQGAITRPYYIGKIICISDKKTKKILTDNVVEYTFSLIKVRDVSPGTHVLVKHLRVPPHYSMGGMAHVNRIRKKIVERAKILTFP